MGYNNELMSCACSLVTPHPLLPSSVRGSAEDVSPTRLSFAYVRAQQPPSAGVPRTHRHTHPTRR